MAPQFRYVRVSNVDQNTDRQLEGLELEEVFIDKVSARTRKGQPCRSA